MNVNLEMSQDNKHGGCTCDAQQFYKKYKQKIDDSLATCTADKTSKKGEIKKKQAVVDSSLKSKSSEADSRKSSKRISINVKNFNKILSISKTKKTKSTEKSDVSVQEIKSSSDTLITIQNDDFIYSYKDDKDVSAYEVAFSAKLDEIIGEEEIEEIPITQQGYFDFHRFLEPSSQESTAYKSSSKSTESTIPAIEEEEEEKVISFHVKQPPEEWMSESMKRALEYLKTHKIEDFFKYMGAHLVANNPCNPIEFLINLLDNCINYRLGYCEPPLLYQLKHIESLFDSMDPMRTHEIDLNQFATGMKTLGIKDFNSYPEVSDRNMVEKKIFLDEAFKYLRKDLDELLQCSAPVPSITTILTSISMKGETNDSTDPEIIN